MMNPASLSLRSVHPLESHAAELLDHRLNFFGPLGYAEAVPSEGSTLHGILHRVDEATMAALDEIEKGYDRAAGRARLYDGRTFDATVYARPPLPRGAAAADDGPPQQRYLEVMIEGAEHFGVDGAHVKFLRNHERRDRPRPDEFESFGTVPEGAPTMTRDEVRECDGRDGGRIRATINGKVVEFVSPEGEDDDEESRERDEMVRRHLSKMLGKHDHILEMMFSKALYDPKYGAPASLDEFTREHSAYMEHLCRTHFEMFGRGRSRWSVVAHIDQTYKD